VIERRFTQVPNRLGTRRAWERPAFPGSAGPSSNFLISDQNRVSSVAPGASERERDLPAIEHGED